MNGHYIYEEINSINKANELALKGYRMISADTYNETTYYVMEGYIAAYNQGVDCVCGQDICTDCNARKGIN